MDEGVAGGGQMSVVATSIADHFGEHTQGIQIPASAQPLAALTIWV